MAMPALGSIKQATFLQVLISTIRQPHFQRRYLFIEKVRAFQSHELAIEHRFSGPNK